MARLKGFIKEQCMELYILCRNWISCISSTKWWNHQKINTPSLVHWESKATSSDSLVKNRTQDSNQQQPGQSLWRSCRRTMSPNTPQHFDRATLRLKKSVQCWLPWTILHSHRTSTPLNIYEALEDPESQAFCDITRSFVETVKWCWDSMSRQDLL